MKNDAFRNVDTKDLQHAIEIGERTWWVGHYLPNDVFQCHAYLIEHGDNSVLVDPGGYLTFHHVYQKVNEIIPFSHVRYFICQHQDPDIAGALKTIDSMTDRCKDALIVTHWRAKELLKHYDLTIPFWDIEEHSWQLDLEGRVLKFVFTPYLHFPGAFCTFDFLSGIMFSSDLFGGFVSKWSLMAHDESYFEDIRLFHEHYMPSSEILLHGLMKLEKYQIRLIAPQHGSIIPGHLVNLMFTKLKQLDCGLYAIARDSTDIRRLSFLSKTLREITNTVIIYHDFRDIVGALLDIFRRTFPVISIEFYAYTSEKDAFCFAPETRYRAVVSELPSYCKEIFDLDQSSRSTQNRVGFKKILLPAKASSCRGNINEHSLLIPLFSPNSKAVRAATILRLAYDLEITFEIEKMLEQMSNILGVAVERECLYRVMDLEYTKLYELSIRDSLTGLYNRFYMEETLKRLLKIHDRNEKGTVVVAMLDLDYFKQLNDTYGHPAGDEILRKTASTLTRCIRSSDIPIRYGGEEFIVFMLGCSTKQGVLIAEKIRHEISQITFAESLKGCKLTVSVGVAGHRQNESLADFIQRADVALYKAKNTGRNRVCSEENICAG
jgi:diguanylate cyclase (GGDEF)-like protein